MGNTESINSTSGTDLNLRSLTSHDITSVDSPHQSLVSSHPSNMAVFDHNDLRERSDTPVRFSPQVQQAQAKQQTRLGKVEQLERELLRARKELEEDEIAVQKMKDEETKQHELRERRLTRQKEFFASIDDSMIAALKERVAADQDLKDAVEEIASGNGLDHHLESLKHVLLDELCGGDVEVFQSLAIRILEVRFSDPKPISILSDFSHKTGSNSGWDNPASEVASPHFESRVLSDLPTSSFEANSRQDSTINEQADPSHVCSPADTDVDGAERDTIRVPMHDTQPQEDANLFVCGSTLRAISSQPFIKQEPPDEVASPFPKRLKLTDIENSRSPRALTSSINDAQDAVDVPNANATRLQAMVRRLSAQHSDDGSKVSFAIGSGPDSMQTDTGTKRSHSVISGSSITPANSPDVTHVQKSGKSEKKFTGPARLLDRKLADDAAKGIEIPSQLLCQKCNKTPKDAKLASCMHIFCTKCVANIRKAAVKKAEEVTCPRCQNVWAKRCNAIDEEHINAWRQKYNEDSGNEDAEDGEDNGDAEVEEDH